MHNIFIGSDILTNQFSAFCIEYYLSDFLLFLSHHDYLVKEVILS